ncbi:hypothetical protein [Streptomyces uncialis]|uniref:hypothetical protein n=1 Tax=Streptomyces uncialis TaxID=1048205 RepID=UPI003866F941|nr:hypothetical protein OG924_17070 [Streptomyces uncialis]
MPQAALAQRKPPTQVVQIGIQRLRQTVPEHLDRFIQNPALNGATEAGHDPGHLLRQAADQRSLADAQPPAQVLT